MEKNLNLPSCSIIFPDRFLEKCCVSSFGSAGAMAGIIGLLRRGTGWNVAFCEVVG